MNILRFWGIEVLIDVRDYIGNKIVRAILFFVTFNF